MSRAKREKTSKLKIWVPIICVIVVGITFYMIHDIQNKIEKMDIQNKTNEQEIVKDQAIDEENTTEENSVENEINYVVENVTSNNTVKNTTSQNKTNTNKNTSQTQSTAPSNPGITDQKQKAIELVKNWVGDDNANYVFDYVNENGEYVIAVKDKTTATVKCYFRVNLETETVELD